MNLDEMAKQARQAIEQLQRDMDEQQNLHAAQQNIQPQYPQYTWTGGSANIPIGSLSGAPNAYYTNPNSMAQAAALGQAQAYITQDVHGNKGICQESYDQGYEDGLKANEGDRIK